MTAAAAAVEEGEDEEGGGEKGEEDEEEEDEEEEEEKKKTRKKKEKNMELREKIYPDSHAHCLFSLNSQPLKLVNRPPALLSNRNWLLPFLGGIAPPPSKNAPGR